MPSFCLYFCSEVILFSTHYSSKSVFFFFYFNWIGKPKRAKTVTKVKQSLHRRIRSGFVVSRRIAQKVLTLVLCVLRCCFPFRSWTCPLSSSERFNDHTISSCCIVGVFEECEILSVSLLVRWFAANDLIWWRCAKIQKLKC